MRRLALGLLALIMAIQSIICLELSGQQLTTITTTGDNLTLSFAFYRDDTLVTTVLASSLAQETTLNLQNNSLSSVPVLLFQAANGATSIDISNNPLTELSATSFVNLPRLERVMCTNTLIGVLPTGLASDCPLLSTLAFNQSTIRTIESQALVNLPKLESLYLAHNNVSVIYGDSFVNLTALHTLDMSYNDLKTVPNGLLATSSSWKALDFSHNNILNVSTGIQETVVEGYISFDYNALVEIDEEAMAGASKIHELRLASNGIFTINSRAFAGMSALRTLNLSDNIISVIDVDAFEDVDGLENLRLDSNNIHRLTLSSAPTSLERLELQDNLMDLMPDFPDDFEASRLVHLNLSRNYLWSISTNDALTPYTGLVTLDLSNNRVVNFSGAVFDPIMSTIESMNFNSNLITSIPSTNCILVVKKLLTNFTLLNNPGIGWSSDVEMRNDCPNGSVFEELDLSSSSSSGSANTASLFGCIQCVAGTFHDNSTGTCVACSEVSPRAYSEKDGAAVCLYCPYSSDLLPNRTMCKDFHCNMLCWLTLSMGIAIPGVIFSSKLLLYLIIKSSKRTRRMGIKEQEATNDWRMGLMMHQLAEPTNPIDDEVDEEASEHGDVPFRIYDLPEETKDIVLSTLQDYFQIRKEKRWRALPLGEQEATKEWNDVEWETFHMHRILNRSYHGEIFLGDYCGTQVVVRRMMTLRFEVKELADTINDVELVSSLHHPNIVACLGTMWSDPEHLCVISEYVKGGDLAAVLEVDGLDRPNRHNSSFTRMSASSLPEKICGKDSEPEPTLSQVMAFGLSKTSLLTRFQIAFDVCKALVYMHDMGVSHNDLRSRNVMVTEMFRCKIGDARHHCRDTKHHATQVRLVESPTDQNSDDEDGVNLESVRFLQSDRNSHKQAELTLPLVAPEVLHHNSRHLHADIYSVGILLLELCFHKYIFFQNNRLNGDFELRSRVKKLRLANDEAKSGTASKDEAAGAAQKKKADNAAMRHFMSKLRMLANVNYAGEADESSFGTTPASSAASLTISLSSSSAIVDKLSGAIGECLQSDPKKRPTAKKLMDLFQFFLNEISAT